MRPDARAWLLPVLAALIVIPYPYFPAIRSPNEGARLYQARAIVDDGTFALDGELRRYGQMGDLSHSDRGYFPNKAPGASILGAGVYWVARLFVGGDGTRVSNEILQYLLRLFCSALPTVALLFFLRPVLWSWAGEGVAADLTLAAYALGSLAYTYGLLYFGHQLTAVCLLGSFLAIEGSRAAGVETRRLGLLAVAGFLAGTAVLVEYPGALAALPLGLYVIWVSGSSVAECRGVPGSARCRCTSCCCSGITRSALAARSRSVTATTSARSSTSGPRVDSWGSACPPGRGSGGVS